MAYLYIETDGEIYLVKKNGMLTLPTESDTLPFKIEKLVEMPIKEEKVIFCRPILIKHPKWFFKDDVPKMNNIEKIVRIAVNRSFVRHTSSAVIMENGKILLLKAARGLIKGMWHFPGGFVIFPSHPEDSLKRECKEELGIEIKIKKLIGIYTNLFKNSYYFMCIPYLCEIVSGKINPNPDEIAELKWVTVDEGLKVTDNPFVIWAMKKLKCVGVAQPGR